MSLTLDWMKIPANAEVNEYSCIYAYIILDERQTADFDSASWTSCHSNRSVMVCRPQVSPSPKTGPSRR